MNPDPTIETSERRKLIRELCRLMNWSYDDDWYQLNTNALTISQMKEVIMKIKLGRVEE